MQGPHIIMNSYKSTALHQLGSFFNNTLRIINGGFKKTSNLISNIQQSFERIKFVILLVIHNHIEVS